MLPGIRFSVAIAIGILLVSSGPLRAQFPLITYELQAGSSVVDECVNCFRPTLELQIKGTFVLQRLPVRIAGELYAISALELSCSNCPGGIQYDFQGEGQLYRRTPETEATTLNLSFNGVSGIVLQNEEVPSAAPWPLIDVTVTEDGQRDPAQKLTLRILAGPKVELTPYELVEGSLADRSGSILEVVCPPCELIHPFIPLQGTLLVGLVEAVADGFSAFRLDGIQFQSLLADAAYTVFGSGSYQEGGDVEILKQMRLIVQINGGALRELRGGPAAVGPRASFPVIDLEVEEAPLNTLWYRLHLVAKPAQMRLFRRGDTNSDGQVDVADPVYHLLWRFAGGSTPSCLEAADSDGDGAHNLTDALFTLRYLFLGGPEPPPPGPTECGAAPQPKFPCASQPPCANRG